MRSSGRLGRRVAGIRQELEGPTSTAACQNASRRPVQLEVKSKLEMPTGSQRESRVAGQIALQSGASKAGRAMAALLLDAETANELRENGNRDMCEMNSACGCLRRQLCS